MTLFLYEHISIILSIVISTQSICVCVCEYLIIFIVPLHCKAAFVVNYKLHLTVVSYWMADYPWGKNIKAKYWYD